MNTQRMVHHAVELLSSGRNYSRVCVFTRSACQGIAPTKVMAVGNLKENACPFMELSTNVSIVLFDLLLTGGSFWALSLTRNFANKD